MTVKDYTTYVYKDQDDYYLAKDKHGKILDENNDAPELILKLGLDRAGKLKLQGDFLCSNGLTTQDGLKLKSNTLIEAGPETYIRVPQGYSGELFVFDYTYQGDTVRNVNVNGMFNVDEQGTPQYLWDAIGIRLQDPSPSGPASRGITMCDFGHMFVRNAKSAINIDLLHTGGWMTSCNFEKMKIYTTKRAMEFVNTAGITSVPGISSNTFEHIWYQSNELEGNTTDYGIKDVMGKNNWFKDVAIWDLQVSDDGGGPGSGHSVSFSQYCEHIFVLGGIMMYYNPINNAPKGAIKWIDTHSEQTVWQYYEELTLFEDVGTGSKNVFTIPHGLNYIPDWVDVIPRSNDALISSIRWLWDATNITVTFQGTPPPPPTAGNPNNVKFAWRASIK